MHRNKKGRFRKAVASYDDLLLRVINALPDSVSGPYSEETQQTLLLPSCMEGRGGVAANLWRDHLLPQLRDKNNWEPQREEMFFPASDAVPIGGEVGVAMDDAVLSLAQNGVDASDGDTDTIRKTELFLSHATRLFKRRFSDLAAIDFDVRVMSPNVVLSPNAHFDASEDVICAVGGSHTSVPLYGPSVSPSFFIASSCCTRDGRGTTGCGTVFLVGVPVLTQKAALKLAIVARDKGWPLCTPTEASSSFLWFVRDATSMAVSDLTPTELRNAGVREATPPRTSSTSEHHAFTRHNERMFHRSPLPDELPSGTVARVVFAAKPFLRGSYPSKLDEGEQLLVTGAENVDVRYSITQEDES
jgi:hypothetical protein